MGSYDMVLYNALIQTMGSVECIIVIRAIANGECQEVLLSALCRNMRCGTFQP